MTKYEQNQINAAVESAARTVDQFANDSTSYRIVNARKLRSCSAKIADVLDAKTGDLLGSILQSYNTVVAYADANGTVYDFLRLVYGYTTTSAQHIAKFAHDIGATKRVTWR